MINSAKWDAPSIHPVWPVFAVCMKKRWIFGYPLSAKWRHWWNWVDAEADLSHRWVHRSFCCFCHAAAHLIMSQHQIIRTTLVYCCTCCSMARYDILTFHPFFHLWSHQHPAYVHPDVHPRSRVKVLNFLSSHLHQFQRNSLDLNFWPCHLLWQPLCRAFWSVKSKKLIIVM